MHVDVFACPPIGTRIAVRFGDQTREVVVLRQRGEWTLDVMHAAVCRPVVVHARDIVGVLS